MTASNVKRKDVCYSNVCQWHSMRNVKFQHPPTMWGIRWDINIGAAWKWVWKIQFIQLLLKKVEQMVGDNTRAVLGIEPSTLNETHTTRPNSHVFLFGVILFHFAVARFLLAYSRRFLYQNKNYAYRRKLFQIYIL